MLRVWRDVVCVVVGAASVLSQIIVQFQKASPSGELLIAGVTLLTAAPFFKLGDRRVDEEIKAISGESSDTVDRLPSSDFPRVEPHSERRTTEKRSRQQRPSRLKRRPRH